MLYAVNLRTPTTPWPGLAWVSLGVKESIAAEQLDDSCHRVATLWSTLIPFGPYSDQFALPLRRASTAGFCGKGVGGSNRMARTSTSLPPPLMMTFEWSKEPRAEYSLPIVNRKRRAIGCLV